jgi:hypothetical protein
VLFVNDGRDAGQVELLVHADADVNVVGHHADGFGEG